jgi:hypothetical protein
MKIRTILAASLLALSIAPPAHAGTKIMASAPALRSYPITTQTLRCNILNLNAVTKPVTIDTLDYSGTITSTSGVINLPPSTGTSFVATDSFGEAAYCRFTVDGSTKKYRAVATYDDGTYYTTAHPAN